MSTQLWAVRWIAGAQLLTSGPTWGYYFSSSYRSSFIDSGLNHSVDGGQGGAAAIVAVIFIRCVSRRRIKSDAIRTFLSNAHVSEREDE